MIAHLPQRLRDWLLAFQIGFEQSLCDFALIVFGVDSLAFKSSAKRVDRLLARMAKGQG